MQKRLLVFVLALNICFTIQAQIKSVYDQMVSVNQEWTNQSDINNKLKQQDLKLLNEQQLIQLHLSETEKLLRNREVSKLSPLQQENRAKNLNVLHQYLLAGIFPLNTNHANRQPYFIDENNTYCAVGYLMKESGADDIARDIQATQNYSYLADIHHPKLMNWVQQSGLTFDELALIQPAYDGAWPSAIMEFHYNNIGTDVNEYIEVHESSAPPAGMLSLKKILFYTANGTLYKTLLATQMQSYYSNGGKAYYYTFSANENFADSGKIELIGLDFSSNEVVLSTTTYNSYSVKVQDNYSSTVKQFNVGENEQTPINTSLTYCGFYYNSNWSLQSLPATIGTQNPCTIMPIGLSKFSYQAYEKKVQLKWETVSEANNHLFIVERSTNGIDFKAIGNVSGTGNSNTVMPYEFIDNKPNFINHYRLKQLDKDGKYSYSKILYVKVENASPLVVRQNLVTSEFHYQVNSSLSGSTIEIFDMTGHTVYKTKARNGVHNVNVSNWAAGKYIIRLFTVEGQMYSQPFVKE